MALQAQPAEIRLMNLDALQTYLIEQKVDFKDDAKRDELEKLALDALAPERKESKEDREEAEKKKKAATAAVAKVEKEAKKSKQEQENPEDFYAMDEADLLSELVRRGFRTKDEIAALITAHEREKKNMAFRHEELQKREEQLEQNEIKLARRIAEAEKEFRRLTTAKEELRATVEKYELAKREFARLSPK